MPVKEILAKDFDSREELDGYVSRECGLECTTNLDYLIKGNKKQLARLHLSERTRVNGIAVEQTDKQVVKKEQKERPFRGKQFDFGINKRDIKNKDAE